MATLPIPATGPNPRRHFKTSRARRLIVLLACTLIVTGAAWPAPVVARSGKSVHARQPKKRHQVGVASFYGRECKGRRTANGERFDPSQLTAAHRTLPFGTCVRVTNLENGRRVVVRINDRGPYARGRVIDVSRAAARRLGFVHDGVTQVRIEVLKDDRGWRDPLADDAGAPRRKPGGKPGATQPRRPAIRKGSPAPA